MNNTAKRIVAAAAAAVMLSAAPIGAEAAVRSNPDMISLWTFSGEDLSGITNTIAEGIFEHRAEIDVSAFNCSQEVALEIVSSLLVKYPDIFFLDRSVPATFTLWGGKLLKITPAYKYSKEETDKRLKRFYTEADKYLSLVNGNMSALEKALVLHDAIVDDASYILDEVNGSGYALLVEKQGICENYSRVYAYLLGQLGIKTEIIDSDTLNHEWVKVNIGGVYYHVDITWDNPLPERYGRVSHRFFLLSDEKIGDKNYSEPHDGYQTINKSWSKTYDGNVMQSITSKCCAVGGKVYCIYNGRNGAQFGSVSFREGYDTAMLSFSGITNLSKLYWRSSPGRNWIGNFSALVDFGGKLYYNSADTVYRFDPEKGKTETVYKLSGDSRSIYGLRIKNGRLYGIMANSPSDAGTEKMLMSLKSSPFDGFKKQLVKLSGRRYTIKKNGIPARFFGMLTQKAGLSSDKKK